MIWQVGVITMDSEAMLPTIEANFVSINWRISGEFGISQSSKVLHLPNLDKSIWHCWIVSHITKILQNFWFVLKDKNKFLPKLKLDDMIFLFCNIIFYLISIKIISLIDTYIHTPTLNVFLE